MKVRFGYVAMALNLEDCSPSKTVTVKNLEKLDPEVQFNKIRRLTRENLHNTLRILKYNAAHRVHLYRLTSKIVPLATHPLLGGWDFTNDFQAELAEIGTYIRSHNMRVSAHPDHFTVINSPDANIFSAAQKDLGYHHRLFTGMGLDSQSKLVMHIGGVYKDKKTSLQRFLENFRLLMPDIRSRIILENDDKSYHAANVLEVCQKLGVPMVLDVHHHNCCNDGTDLAELLPAIFDTWADDLLPPKIHISSPRGTRPGEVRMHADYVDPLEFYSFLLQARKLGRDFDVMVEAKAKNLAMHKLITDISLLKGVTVVEDATIELLIQDLHPVAGCRDR